MELKPSRYGILVKNNEVAIEYPLRGLVFPYGCRLNDDSKVEKYFNGQMPKTQENREILKNTHPKLYEKFNYVHSIKKA